MLRKEKKRKEVTTTKRKEQRWRKKARERSRHRRTRGSTKWAQTQYLFQINPLLEVIRHWQAQALALAREPGKNGREKSWAQPCPMFGVRRGNPALSTGQIDSKAHPLAMGPTPPKKGTLPPGHWTLDPALRSKCENLEMLFKILSAATIFWWPAIC